MKGANELAAVAFTYPSARGVPARRQDRRHVQDYDPYFRYGLDLQTLLRAQLAPSQAVRPRLNRSARRLTYAFRRVVGTFNLAVPYADGEARA